ncbi:nitroreductase family protein [bacterium]|nr:nitroreductase family protein [bacterium]
MIDAILARRSIRSYTDEPVSEEHITAMLEAAMSAPSGMNRKPWHFVVVSEREKLDRLGATTKSWGMLKEATLAVVVCGDPGISEKYWDQDSIAALENLLIAVSMLGLGAVWLGCHPNPERVGPVREILGVPEPVVPIAVLSIGHPAEEKEPRTQYDEERVHRNGW